MRPDILKVVQLGLEQRVYNAMKKPQFSVESITRQFNSEGINISAQSIRKFIKNTKKAQKQLIASDLSVANEIKALTLDYNKAIRSILDEVNEVKDMARNEKDYATYNQLVGRLMQGIELIAKLTGDLKQKGQVDINIIYNEISNDINKKMQDNNKFFKQVEVVNIDELIEEEDEEQSKIIKGE